jgi:transcriptional regulator GlxA family with amidase domain
LDAAHDPAAACRAVLKTLAPIRRRMLREADADAKFFSALGRFVRDRIDDDLTLTAAARHFDLPPSTLTRRIERRYGVTFTGYVARQRLDRAKDLLRRTSMNVETIARRVGLTDGAHLRKQLQRFEGVTPGDIRAGRPQKKASG